VGEYNTGTISVFKYNSPTWTFVIDLYCTLCNRTQDGQDQNADFGYVISLSGDVLAAGVPNFRSQGAVLIYHQNSGGVDQWGMIRNLTIPLTSCSSFGRYLQTNGNLLVTSCPYVSPGKVLIYSRDLGGTDNWGLMKTISNPFSGGTNLYFGRGFAMADGHLAVSSYYHSTGSYAPYRVAVLRQNEGGTDNFGVAGTVIGTETETLNNEFISMANQHVLVFSQLQIPPYTRRLYTIGSCVVRFASHLF
jgi:hypothetical protein